MLSETRFVPTVLQNYLMAKVLRSERVVDTDELWRDVGVPSLAGKTLGFTQIVEHYTSFFANVNSLTPDLKSMV